MESFEGQEMEIDQKLPTQDQRVPAANGVADDGEYHIFIDCPCAIIKGVWVPTINMGPPVFMKGHLLLFSCSSAR